jgi:hypothetical protein
MVCLCLSRPLLGGLTVRSAVLITLALFAAVLLLTLEGVISALSLQME